MIMTSTRPFKRRQKREERKPDRSNDRYVSLVKYKPREEKWKLYRQEGIRYDGRRSAKDSGKQGSE